MQYANHSILRAALARRIIISMAALVASALTAAATGLLLAVEANGQAAADASPRAQSASDPQPQPLEARDTGSPHASSDGELARYVFAPDSSYGWKQVSEGRIGTVQYSELILTSQTWRGIPWKHQLFVLRPSKLSVPTNQAFLFIHSGRWSAELEAGLQSGRLPREAHSFARLATEIGAPLAVLRQVPHQPLFERTEDTLIAYTFERFIQTGEPDWPLLLPMVKSAVRGMDAVQQYLRERWQIPIESFTVTGASKRGWTSWLTAAVDPRVAAVAPMVIDILNIPAQIELQRASFGELSEQVQDYAEIHLPDYVDTPAGQRLLNIVDPFRYRDRLTRPKLILLGTNDRYWPLDALKLYWSELPEPKRVLYIPNEGHGINDVRRLLGALTALHRYSAAGASLPEVQWSFARKGSNLALDVRTDSRPRRVIAWTASAPTRDFRDAQWTQHRCRPSGEPNAYTCQQPLSRDRYTALYAEAQFSDRGALEFSLSTAVCIEAWADSQPVGELDRQCALQNKGSQSVDRADGE